MEITWLHWIAFALIVFGLLIDIAHRYYKNRGFYDAKLMKGKGSEMEVEGPSWHPLGSKKPLKIWMNDAEWVCMEESDDRWVNIPPDGHVFWEMEKPVAMECTQVQAIGRWLMKREGYEL